jgi:hypothetical protein
MSVKSLTTIFVKIIFTHKSLLKIHLIVSWLKLLPQPLRRYLSLWANDIRQFSTFWLDLHVFSLLPSVSYMFSWPSTNYLCHSQTSAFFTTSGPYVSDSNAEVSHALLPNSKKNLKLIICSKLWPFILLSLSLSLSHARARAHTHTHTHMHTRALFHSFDTSDATVFTSQPTQWQNTYKQVTEFFNKWHTHQQKGPTSSLQVHSLCKYTSSKCTQVESVSEITPVRTRAACHTANIHSIVGLAVQGVQRLTYKAQTPWYHIQHILVKCLKTSRCLNVQITNNF